MVTGLTAKRNLRYETMLRLSFKRIDNGLREAQTLVKVVMMNPQ
jgi:hypothetical protein